ncbi:MAG: sn-glycerol-3-phosphate ABC transporter ATP-binding protein UgpC [Candidatus Eisenbacteria bacterium]|uniref:sn-glycerol-3-phosphate ABC transporter ATP-binding protein UgpC n=1 Tax=Eiseniibacteriota bacterium TaxID=2212470 RepID=A0A538U671_UNCEI|nr:MAG: sn-glycerol-3-phosphate ABC transporter ATP-binding protein UgpC [Candidatus Eisenbacteria bacterium]
MAAVTLKGVSKSFGKTRVIENLDLEVRDQEFMVLVGPSGCGKSTALRMIAGLEDVTAGQVLIGDQLVNDLPPKARDIAMVFQSYALYPHMTVRENMAFGLKIRRLPADEIDRLVSEAARVLDLQNLLDRRPRELSGGQRQRVAVGRAIVRKPAVFLFDEPLSNLDAKLRVQMRAEIARLQRDLKTTTVYVTHDQVEAMTMGTRIAVLNDGALQQVGTPLDVYERPMNLFVAQFIGTPPMNFMKATIGKDGATLEGAALRLPTPASWRALAARHVDRAVVIGIRPENIALANGAAPAHDGVTAVVEVVELLGSEAVFHGRVGDDLLAAKTESRHAPSLGASVPLRFDLEALHLFDAASQRRLE